MEEYKRGTGYAFDDRRLQQEAHQVHHYHLPQTRVELSAILIALAFMISQNPGDVKEKRAK